MATAEDKSKSVMTLDFTTKCYYDTTHAYRGRQPPEFAPALDVDDRSLRIVSPHDLQCGTNLRADDVLSSEEGLSLPDLWRALTTPRKPSEAIKVRVRRALVMKMYELPGGFCLRLPEHVSITSFLNQHVYNNLPSAHLHVEEKPDGRAKVTRVSAWPSAGEPFVLDGKLTIVPDKVETTYLSMDEGKTWRDVGANKTVQDLFGTCMTDKQAYLVTDSMGGGVRITPTTSRATVIKGQFLQVSLGFNSY